MGPSGEIIEANMAPDGGFGDARGAFGGDLGAVQRALKGKSGLLEGRQGDQGAQGAAPKRNSRKGPSVNYSFGGLSGPSGVIIGANMAPDGSFGGPTWGY